MKSSAPAPTDQNSDDRVRAVIWLRLPRPVVPAEADGYCVTVICVDAVAQVRKHHRGGVVTAIVKG